MKRLLCALTALCLLSLLLAAGVPALAEASAAKAGGLTESQPLAGERFFPDGANAQSATFTLRYTLPQFAGDQPAAKSVNASFQAMADDLARASLEDMVPDTLAGDSPGLGTELTYRITANNADYVSVLLSNRQNMGSSEAETCSAVTYALSGVYEGQELSLSQAMGLEQAEGETVSDTTYASELVYGLVWNIIADQAAALQVDYFPELTQADLRRALNPESDFYLDADGNFVFFIQSGVLAGEVEGILTFPFSTAELLSAVKPQG